MARTWTTRLPLLADLWDKPQVRKLAAALKIDRWGVVARVVRFWVEAQCKANEKGVLERKSAPWLDALVECEGFAVALAEVGWLELREEGLAVPEFDTFISKRAIRRMDKADWMFAQRTATAATASRNVDPTWTECRPNVDRMDGITQPPEPDPAPTLPPKKPRVRKAPAPPGEVVPLFDRFWSAYPRKEHKLDAMRAWTELVPKPDEPLLVRMLAAVQRQALSPQWTKDNGQFIPHPASWLRGRRWEDEGTLPGGPVPGSGRVQSGNGRFTSRRDLSADEAVEPGDQAAGGGGSLFPA